MKERAPKSLAEALCIALRLEVWAKSVKRDQSEDDRPDRPDRGRQKVTFAAKPETPKKTYVPASDDRLTRIESEMSKVQNELKKLTMKPQAQGEMEILQIHSGEDQSRGSLTKPGKDTSH